MHSSSQSEGNYYAILGVPPNASLAQIKRAYRRLAHQYHPDVNPGDRAAVAKFEEITQVYKVLSDPVARAHYDQEWQVGASGSPGPTRTTNPAQPSDAGEKFLQGVRCLRRGDYTGAIAAFTAAIQLDAQFAEAYNQRGYARYKLRDDVGAFADYRNALQINPNLAEAFYHRGRLRFDQGYVAGAIADYTEALQLQPNLALAYYHRALAYRDGGDVEAAKSDLHQAIVLFEAQADREQAVRAQTLLKPLTRAAAIPTGWGKVILATLQVMGASLTNPIGGLPSVFTRLSQRQAIAVSLILAASFMAAMTIGFTVAWESLYGFRQAPIGRLLAIAALSWLGLGTLKGLAAWLGGGRRTWPNAWFGASVALLPLGIWLVSGGLLIRLGIGGMTILAIVAFSHMVLLLYSSGQSLLHLTERQTTVLVPVWLIVSLLPLMLLR